MTNTPWNGGAEFPVDAEPIAPAETAAPRLMYWSIRRELFENRSVYLAPLIVAAIVLFSLLISTLGMPRKVRRLATSHPAAQHAVMAKPLSIAPAPIMFVTFLVGMFYSLEALYGERRDRSILFWKSLPVSDVTTVLSKAAIPLVVLPLIAFALSVIAVTVLLFAGTAALLVSGMSPAPLWRELQVVQEPVVMIYGLAVHALWFAPIYGWFLLVSAWARRAPFLWGVLPWLALSAIERAMFNSSYFFSMLRYRWTGAMSVAFAVKGEQGGVPMIDLAHLTPGRFLATPGLWIGLLVAAACLAAAVRLRRNREPI